MPCHAVRLWTFTGLVGAFLDLSITFLFLCASSLAYFASKFLALFRLNLPCPCNGYFGIPNSTNSNSCLQRQLVDFSYQKISSVQSSVKSKFPFDYSQWKPNSNLENERNDKNGGVGSEGDASNSERRTENIIDGDLDKVKEKGFVMGAMNLPDIKNGKFEFKGKCISRRRSRNGLRRRRKDRMDHNGKFSWIPSYKSFWSDNAEETPRSAPASISNIDYPFHFKDRKESLVDIGSKRKFSHGFELNESVDENEPVEEKGSFADDLTSNWDQDLDGKTKNTIRLLEQALEEEHAARAVLYIELEKERSAAATAADEAMAMILRLQEEKASIEMEARQCQRIVEEKYEYDAEEMNILKEILVRREREKYFLEKEVEAYRQMISGNEQFEADMFGMAAATKGETMLCASDDDSILMPPLPNSGYNDKKEKAQKEILPSSNSNPDDSSSNQEGNARNNLHSQKSMDKENECDIHDVHVIEDQLGVYKRVMGDKNKQCWINIAATPNNTSTTIAKTSNSPSISMGLPPIGSSKSKAVRPDMRRKSMSAFDAEKFKIDNEISWLREKLKLVQEGRDKLKFTKGNKDREKIELQIITSQIQEIRQLTEHGKAARRASLPPLSSNVMLKKRRWRSGPLILDGST